LFALRRISGNFEPHLGNVELGIMSPLSGPSFDLFLASLIAGVGRTARRLALRRR
jgi:hypothetical protein